MKIAIVGAGHIGLAAAVLFAQQAKQMGIEAEARAATPAEEKYCRPVVPIVIEPRIMREVIAFEQPRFNGYMGRKPKRRF